MKKFAASVIVAVAILAVFILLRGPGLEIPFAGAFPEGAIGYLGVRGGSELVSDLVGSNFWIKLNGVASVRDFARKARATIGVNGVPVPAFNTLAELLGENAAAAVYGKESRFGRSVLAAVKTRDKGEAILAFVRSGLGGKSAGSYRGRDLYSFRIPAFVGIEGIYASGDKTVVAVLSQSNPMELMKASLDLSVGEGGRPLSEDGHFKAGLGQPLRGEGKLLACGYLDPRAVDREFEGLKKLMAARMRERNLTAADAIMKMAPAASWVGYLYRDHGLVGRSRMRMDGARMSAEQRALLEGGSAKLELLRYAPAGTIALSDARLGNIREAWKLYRSLAGVGKGVDIIALCEEKWGVNFEREVLPWIGEEISFQLSDVVTGGLLPVPRAEMILSVKDRGAAEKTLTAGMERIARSPAAQTPQAWAFLKPAVSSEEYSGEKIRTLSYPIPGFSPSFAIKDGFLIAGLDGASVRKIIDVGAGAQSSILTSEMFAEMRKALPAKLNRLSYIDCGRALEAGEGVFRWLFAVSRLTTAADNPEKARRLEKAEADLPRIFNALRVFRAAMTGRSVSGDTVEQYFILRMRDI